MIVQGDNGIVFDARCSRLEHISQVMALNSCLCFTTIMAICKYIKYVVNCNAEQVKSLLKEIVKKLAYVETEFPHHDVFALDDIIEIVEQSHIAIGVNRMMLTKHGKKRIKSRARKEIAPEKLAKRASKYGVKYNDIPYGKLRCYIANKMHRYDKASRIILYNQSIFVLDRNVDKIVTMYKAPPFFIKEIDELCAKKKKALEETNKQKCIDRNREQAMLKKLNKNKNRI